MTGAQFKTFCTEVNGGDPINDTVLFQLINIAKSLVEQRRPWMILRKIDTSKTLATSNTWQTATSLASITDFNRFYGDYPVRLYDGSNRIEFFKQMPFEERVRLRDAAYAFFYDEANKNLYFAGTIAFAGTLYISYLRNTSDVVDGDSTAWEFPAWAHPLLGLMAVAMHKGGIDYDDINARMAPENRAVAELIMKQLENWDNEKQLQAVENWDREGPGEFRASAINIP